MNRTTISGLILLAALLTLSTYGESAPTESGTAPAAETGYNVSPTG